MCVCECVCVSGCNRKEEESELVNTKLTHTERKKFLEHVVRGKSY